MDKRDICGEFRSYLDSVYERMKYNKTFSENKYTSMFYNLRNEITAGLLECDSIYLESFFDKMYLSSYNLNTFFANLMVLTRGLEFQKDDIDNFEVLLDDISGLDIKVDSLEEFPFSFFYSDTFREIIDFIVSNENYKSTSSLRKFLISFLNNLNTPDLHIRLYKECIRDDNLSDLMLTECGGKSNKVAYTLLGERFDNLIQNNLLFQGNRYFYVNEKLLEIEKNHLFRRTIFSVIANLNKELFDYLNTNSSEDIFIRCMDIVFDSDSYSELSSKLRYLGEISEYFKLGNRFDCDTVISSLLSSSHKEIYLGREVSYSKNTMNLVSKPKTIIGRMEELYSKIDGNNWDVEEEYYMANSIGTLCLRLDGYKVKK